MSKRVSSLWVGGDLGPYEKLCLQSFVRQGYEVQLFTYENNLEPLEGIDFLDASEILPLGGLAQDLFIGRRFPQLSDLFRYSLLNQHKTTWVDTDVFCLSPEMLTDDYLFAWESDETVATGVLRYPSDSILSTEMVRMALSKKSEEIMWSEIGPILLTHCISKLNLEHLVKPRFLFYPVHYAEVGLLFDPQQREVIESKIQNSSGMHLWNEMLRRVDPIKKLAPPEGSWLSAKFIEFNIEFSEQHSHSAEWVKSALNESKFVIFERDHLLAERDHLLAERDHLLSREGEIPRVVDKIIDSRN